MTFHILTLSGGGYLGLFAAQVLAEMEIETGAPIARRFDLVAGTSIGGIIALGLAAEVPAERIRRLFDDQGAAIFSDRPRASGTLSVAFDVLRSAVKPKYDGKALRSTINEIFGDKTLGDLEHRVIVPTVNMTKGSVQIFKTPHHKNFSRDYKLRLTDVGLATSAAPTYFPLAQVGDALFVDGGICANSPDLCALHEACHFLDQQISDLRVLSIGTTTSKFSLAHAGGARLGAFQWLSHGRLFSTMIAAQQQMVDNFVTQQMGNAYLRVDAVQSPEQQMHLGLDVATRDAARTIRGLAEGAYQSVAPKAEFRAFLGHTAGKPNFFYGRHAK